MGWELAVWVMLELVFKNYFFTKEKVGAGI